MDWSAISAFANLVAALGVIGSLIFVAIQVRQNTRSLNRASMQTAIRDRLEASHFVAGDADLSDLLWRGAESPDALSDKEWQRFFLICNSIVRSNEVAFIDYRNGLLSKKLWSGQNASIKFWFSKPGFARWLKEHGDTLHPDFTEYVSSIARDASFEKNESAHLDGQTRSLEVERITPHS